MQGGIFMIDKPKKYWKLFVIFWSAILLCLAGAFLFFWLIAEGKLGFMPTFEELENPNNRFASEVYFEDGPVMNKYFEKENRKYTEYKEIPQTVIDALIATEDVRFYDHSGVDVRGLFREGEVRSASNWPKCSFRVKPI